MTDDDPEDARADELAPDVDLDPDLPTPDLPRQPVRKGKTPARKRDEQDLSFREIVFWCVLIALGLSYLSTGAMMWLYLRATRFQPDPTIMIAWISASVVQLIGLLYIITRSLFPPGSP